MDTNNGTAVGANEILKGGWVIVESHGDTNLENGGGVLTSSRQFTGAETLWRFSITDDFNDGLCCDYGQGWVTITNNTGAVWSLPGHKFQSESQVFIFMDTDDGSTRAIRPDDDNSGEINDIPGMIDYSILAEDFPGLPSYTMESLAGPGGSPCKGLTWLLGHPDYTDMPDWRKGQVFALATFLYAVECAKWLHYDQSECIWAFKPGEEEEDSTPVTINRCEENGALELLDEFDLYELYGTLPAELGMLTMLTTLEMPNNSLSSTLPSEMFALPNLIKLRLPFNEFLGELPSVIGMITSLVSLTMNNNAFSGSIPDEISKLSNLRFFSLNSNSFDGKIATEVCKIELSWINVDCFRVSCPCESCRC